MHIDKALVTPIKYVYKSVYMSDIFLPNMDQDNTYNGDMYKLFHKVWNFLFVGYIIVVLKHVGV